MRLKNVLIVVKNIERSIAFYKEIFGLSVIRNNDGNVVMTEGLVLQEAALWKSVLDTEVIPKNNSCELYFEEWDIESFVEKLKNYKEPVEMATPLMTCAWGQKVVRFYDPDGHLIEVRTPGCKPPLVILTGPTAVGKTALSIALAKRLDGEIISADSMQVYRHMDIGSAKILPEEMQGVPHHLIDILEPWEDFNVVAFQTACKKAIADILSRGKMPILVGGTGFYIQAVLRDIDFTENGEDDSYRKELEEKAELEGAEALHQMLEAVDWASAEAIPAGNVKRVIRALEFYHFTGQRISEHNERERERENAYNACYFVLNDDRDKIYERIEKRVDLMLEQGLVDEVKRLKDMGCKRGQTAMQGIGYKEILDYLEGECTLEDAVNLIKRDTRHFAKRQLTWFRREKEVIWVNRQEFGGDESAMLEYMVSRVQR